MTEAFAFVGFAGKNDLAQVGQINARRGKRIPASEVDRDEKFGAAVVENVIGVACRVGGVQRHGNQCVAKGGHVERQCVDAVGQKHGHARTALQAHLRKGLAPAHHPFGELTPGDTHPFVGAVFKPLVSFTVGIDARRALKHFGNRFELVDKSGGQNCGSGFICSVRITRLL